MHVCSYMNIPAVNVNSNTISSTAIICHKRNLYKMNKQVKESLLRELVLCIWEWHTCMHVRESRIHAVKSCNLKWLPYFEIEITA